MRSPTFAGWTAALLLGWALSTPAAAQELNNETCLGCHGMEGFSAPGPDGKMRNLYVDPKVFAGSVHAPRECVNCHQDIKEIPHKPAATPADRQLAITKNCGGCHADRIESYLHTYHGKVMTLGYAHIAKCFDCHGTHDILRVKDPKSKVHPDNRLQTCRACHKGATAGFVTFEPHAVNNDFKRFPHNFIAWNMMFGLLTGTFAFFWTHTALWFYREYKDRQARKARTHVRTEGLIEEASGRQFRRFPWGWRLAHLCFALSLMVLTLTGMTIFYAHTDWAPVVSRALGGPMVTGIIHRVAAVVFALIFFGHLVYVVTKIVRGWKTFKWFGPHSMVPNLQDLKDIILMFKWFFGKGPRPVFERWTYWEKFDYWAPFWGVTIIGVSGAMLWFHNATASVLPGWVFNVATIFHGEEALLAALFLFTVHFFNNHFRPDKFPLDVVMFTGSMPIEEFRREHTREYERLVATGELEKHLVDAPSRPMTIGSRILGFTLIAIGLTLLALVVIGLISSIFG